MIEEVSTKGQLRLDYYIACGIYEDGEHVAEYEREKAAKAAREACWKYTKKHGLICRLYAEDSKGIKAVIGASFE